METNADFPNTVYRDDPVMVTRGRSVEFYPGVGFAGALTGSNCSGTIHEFNLVVGSVTFYDDGMEMGMDNSILGPSDGSDMIVGEQNCVEQVNKAWDSVSSNTQQACLTAPTFRGLLAAERQLSV